jgi:CrcB protein
MTSAQPVTLPLIAAVAAGGAIGSTLRFGVSHAMRGLTNSSGWPVATLTVNVLGSLVLGWVLARAIDPSSGLSSPSARAFVVVGLLGGFTTFSAFSGEVLALLQSSQIGRASAYAIVSVGLAVAATLLGYTIARATS